MSSLFRNLIGRAGENFKLLFQIRDDPSKVDIDAQNGTLRVGIQKPISPCKLLAKLETDHWLALLAGFIAFYADFLDVS